MKHLVLIFLSIFLFLGCTTQKTITIKPVKQKPVVKRDYEYKEIKQEKEITFEKEEHFKVAVVFPSKVVGKYANNTINTILGYLLYQNESFEIETFDSMNQSYENIEKSFNEIEEKGFKRIIAMYTIDALPIVADIASAQKSLIYFPLINKEAALDYDNKYFMYGAISYENQMKEILKLSNNNNSMFYEDSSLGNKLKNRYSELVEEPFISKVVSRIDTKYKELVEDELLNDTTLVLNTPIIKSSIILSQLRAHEIKPTLILSTQLNYNPILVSLTQFEDRVNFITANSIEPVNDILTETLSLLSADIKYNWVNYSSLVGINYYFSKNDDALIKNDIIDNQVLYDVHLYNSTAYGFQKIEF